MKKLMLLTLVLAFSCAAADSRQGTPDTDSCESLQVISATSPNYPAIAAHMSIHGRVEVQIQINESGDVVDATSVGPAMLQFASMNAAKRWKFKGTGKSESGRLMFEFVLYDDKKNPNEDGGAVFFPPCRIEVRHPIMFVETDTGSKPKKHKSD
jgi:TonB family protein